MNKKIALVLSSGGARGIAHIAVIDELERRGYEICSVAGTSMGAFVGGIYASGNLPLLKEWMYSLKAIDIVKLFDFSFSNNGLVKGKKIFLELGKLFPDVNIEDMPLPFVAVSTDIVNNEEVVFRKGSLFDAIRASISIPTFFKPFKNEERLLVDGGLLNPAPINRIKRFDGDSVFVVNVETMQKDEAFGSIYEQVKADPKVSNSLFLDFHRMPGYVEQVNKTIGIMLGQIAELSLEINKPDLVMNINREFFGTYDFHKYEEIMEIGKIHAQVYLDRYEEQLKNQEV